MIIAMVKAEGLAFKSQRYFFKTFSQSGDLESGHGSVRPFLQPVLQKMIELPHVKAKVEALLKRKAGVVPLAAAADLQEQELVDCLSVPSEDFVFWQALDFVPQGYIA